MAMNDFTESHIQKVPVDANRDVFLLSAKQLADFRFIEKTLPHNFLLSLWVDAGTYENKDSLAGFAKMLLILGTVAVHSGGTEGELMDDIFDGVIVESEVMDDPKARRFPPYVYDGIDTSWHNNSSLEEVIWNTLNASYIPEEFALGSLPLLVVVVGDQEPSAILRAIEDAIGGTGGGGGGGSRR